MKFKLIAIMAVGLILSACGNPVPIDKRDYVGEWQSKEMYLLILQDGTVAYKRLKNGGTTSVNGPLKEFVGNNFVVGISFFATTFEVSEPPTMGDGVLKMTVDGIRLTRTEE